MVLEKKLSTKMTVWPSCGALWGASLAFAPMYNLSALFSGYLSVVNRLLWFLCGHIGLWTGLLAKCDHLRMSIRSQIIGSCDLPERLKCVSGMSDAREEVSEAKFR